MLMTKKMNEKEDPETLKEAFRILDADGSGSISREEMRVLMVSFSKMGENVPDGGEIELKPSYHRVLLLTSLHVELCELITTLFSLSLACPSLCAPCMQTSTRCCSKRTWMATGRSRMMSSPRSCTQSRTNAPSKAEQRASRTIFSSVRAHQAS